jgi:hypothetical protein
VRQRDRGELHPFGVAEDRLVREVEHSPRPALVDRPGERGGDVLARLDHRDAQVERAARVELLGAPDEERERDEVAPLGRDLDPPAGDGRIVLPVDESDDVQRTSSGSIGSGGGYSPWAETGERC